MRLGLQKLTLLDFPGSVACTVFTTGCNFRCPFCHNASLVLGSGEQLLSETDVLDFLKKRTGILDGVCLTGGEPLLHKEILDFAAEVKTLGYKLKIDTNGSFPDRLEQAISSGVVDYVAMDIKNSPEKYALTIGTDAFLPQVELSVNLLKTGRVPFEFRTTVTGNLHEKSDFTAIGEWISGTEKYFLQPYSESEDVLKKSEVSPVGREQLNEFLAEARKFVPEAQIRGMTTAQQSS